MRIASPNQLHNVGIAFEDRRIVAAPMWEGAMLTILNTVFGVTAVAAAFSAQCVKRAIAKQAVEFFFRNI